MKTAIYRECKPVPTEGIFSKGNRQNLIGMVVATTMVRSSVGEILADEESINIPQLELLKKDLVEAIEYVDLMIGQIESHKNECLET